MESHLMKLPRACSLIILFIVHVFLLLCTRSIEAGVRSPLAQNNNSIRRLFVFGDSIVDSGNNNYLKTTLKSNFPPYGRDFMGGAPTGRFSNGKVISDFIAEELGIQQLSPPPYLDPNLNIEDYYNGANFASSGSGFDPRTPNKILVVLPISDQLELFKDYIVKLRGNAGEERTNTILNNSLYLVSSGNNDIGSYFLLDPIRKLQYDIPSYIDFLVSQASAFFKDLHQLGARKIAVLSTITVGCVPLSRTLAGGLLRECAEDISEASEIFNTKLSSEIDYLNSNLSQANFVYLDVYNPLLHLIQKPELYGFSIVDRGCCGTGTLELAILCNNLSPGTCTDTSSYLFWDSVHPSEKAYKIIVSNILQEFASKLY